MGTKHHHIQRLALGGVMLPLVFAAACGLPTTESDIKFAGVGLNPDEIGAEAAGSGGLVEYNWVEFAGGQLSLGALGLLSFDEAGPAMVDFKPPYAIVNGTAFVFPIDTPAPDSAFGSFAKPPANIGSCHTVYEPQSYLSGVADAGAEVTLTNEDGSAGFSIGRRPYVFAPLVQSVFPYYSELASWRPVAWTHKVRSGTGNTLADLTEEVLARPNYPFGETVTIDFAGGLPPAEATYASVPVPLSSTGADRTIQVPARPQGFMLEWTGPRFDAQTLSWQGEGEEQATCLHFLAGDAAPADPTQCAEPPAVTSDVTEIFGQIYTAPWDTEDGLTVRWEPETDTTDVVSFTVRILGQVDETESYFVTDAVTVAADDEVRAEWQALINAGDVPEGTPVPEGFRSTLSCDPEEDVQWIFDPSFKQGDGDYIPSLQGDPLRTLAEVTCTLDPSAGSFTMTEDMLAPALQYADQHGGAGAVFYVGRTQTKQIELPAVRDEYGSKRVVSPMTAVTKAVQVGRFWYDR
ncbi:MAG: hypothetical protein H6742_06340 [Alphaproteobacteria bacterium]|nr:hypothetical protein [Alphaproteobacteria bacterium]